MPAYFVINDGAWYRKTVKLASKNMNFGRFVTKFSLPWVRSSVYSFNKAWTQVLHRFKSCLWRIEGLRWWGLEIRRETFRQSTIPQKHFSIMWRSSFLAHHLAYSLRRNEFHEIWQSPSFLSWCNEMVR